MDATEYNQSMGQSTYKSTYLYEKSHRMMMAPIAIFVYKRPLHTEQMLRSLVRNQEYSLSPITIYCDGPKNDLELKEITATRNIVRKLLPKANIIEREENLGLSESIINGVTEQCNTYGQTIVIEDDLILSPVTLQYLNRALIHYKECEKVMHITAYMYPVSKCPASAFFYREASCWGWATWSRAWKYFEYDAKKIADYLFRNRLVTEFNVKHSYLFWELLLAQEKGEVDSWAIRWYGSMFMKRGLALHPMRSLIKNIGMDGSGEHCGETEEYKVDLSEEIPPFPEDITEDNEAMNSIIENRKKYHNVLVNKLSHLIRTAQYLSDRTFSKN